MHALEHTRAALVGNVEWVVDPKTNELKLLPSLHIQGFENESVCPTPEEISQVLGQRSALKAGIEILEQLLGEIS